MASKKVRDTKTRKHNKKHQGNSDIKNDVEEAPKPLEGTKKTEKPRKTQEQDNRDTLFIRNLSFDTEESRLKEFIEENFGHVEYCLICRDKDTQESKGTAFVKFKEAENATKCLDEFRDRELQVKFQLDGRNLMLLPALTRDKVEEIKKIGTERKDKRNLGLARVGYFRPDSEEIKEMSKADAEKRKTLDLRKREKLKNLHNFVSDRRLCIHNLPASMDDKTLRLVFSKALKDVDDAKIVECRVMKHKKGGGQLGSSKGFGFVSFSKHEHALTAIERINNNPKTFSIDKRPIVEFSIENLVALNKKKTRLVNSQRKNAHAKQINK